MGTVVKRKTKKGIKYVAEVRKTKKGEVIFYRTATFFKEKNAKEWIKKIEQTFIDDPERLLNTSSSMTLSDAITLYLDAVGKNYGRTVNANLKFIQEKDISKLKLSDIKRKNYAQYAVERAEDASPATVNQDFQHIRSVIKHVIALHDARADLNELTIAMDGLRSSRIIAKSKKRDRLLTNDEATQLTQYFYKKYNSRKSAYPMHLIMWLAIYSCRRQGELTRLRLDDDSGEYWLLRDAKNPNGSDGNHKHTRISEKCRDIISLLLDEKIRDKMKDNNRFDSALLLPLAKSNISARFTEACKMLDIQDLNFHDLRHEGATRYAEQGLTIPQIQEYTAHDSWSSLERYVNTKKMKRAKALDYIDIMQS